MCETSNPLSFEGLEDESEWDGSREAPAPSINPHIEDIGSVEIPGFIENCPKCGGTGNFRNNMRCFKCNGRGKLQFKTSPEARAKSRKSARARKVKVAGETKAAFWAALNPVDSEFLKRHASDGFFASLIAGGEKYGQLTDRQLAIVRERIAQEADAADAGAEWAKHHKAEHEWLVTQSEAGNEFANSLLNSVRGRGSLTENQLAAVRRNLDKAKAMPASELDISSLKGYYAVPDGDTRLKICVRKPGKNSRYLGWTFVDDGAAYGSRRNYGKQAPDGTYQGSIQDALAAILADPFEAQVAYGKLTGTCGACGRLLEDEDSIAAGIGPVCAAKY